MIFGKYKKLNSEFMDLLNKYEQLEEKTNEQNLYIEKCISEIAEYENNLILLGNHCEELEKELKKTKASNSALKRYNEKYKKAVRAKIAPAEKKKSAK